MSAALALAPRPSAPAPKATLREPPAPRPAVAGRADRSVPGLPAYLQRAALAGEHHDAAEREAIATSRAVLTSGAPALHQRVAPTLQRAPAAPGGGGRSGGAGPAGGGEPLPPSVLHFMEPRFGADFSGVRVHNGADAARMAAAVNARAFTSGSHLVFGQGQYQPDSAAGRELIAHELTHTIQQGAVRQVSPGEGPRPSARVLARSSTALQRFDLGFDGALDYFAEQAQQLPSFKLLTFVLGRNPVSNKPVQASAADLLREVVRMVPVIGDRIAQALDAHKVFDRVAAWVKTQLAALGASGAALYAELVAFARSVLGPELIRLGLSGVWERGKRIVTAVIDRIRQAIGGLVDGILGFVRDAVLRPLAALASGTAGWDLLCAVLGRNPITNEEVPQTPEALVGGFMKLIGQEEVWQRIRESGAIAKVMAWFRGAMQTLLGFVRQLPPLALAALRSLEVEDFLLLPRAIAKVLRAFSGFAATFVAWGTDAVWKLLEIVFKAVSPGTWDYISRTGAALRRILRDPIPFVRNLVRAAMLGFNNFGKNFLNHLKAGLIQWLVGALPGVYIPAALSLPEIFKFVSSVLGLTWANVRGKLVKAIGETAVVALETGFDIVVTLVRDGPAAAWDKIKEQLGNLKDMAIGAIQGFVVDMVVQRAIPKLVSMFIPGAGFLSAIVSIYETVMVFVNRLGQIMQVVKGFIDGIVAIANGQIDPAATRVESILGNLLALAISFFAAFVGLGRVSDKIMAVIQKIREPIDKAIDFLVAWIVKAGKAVFAKAKAGARKLLDWWRKKVPLVVGGEAHTLQFDGEKANARLVVRSTPELPSVFVETRGKARGRKKPEIDTAVTKTQSLEKPIQANQEALVPLDKTSTELDDKTRNDANVLMDKLDKAMHVLVGHITTTLTIWGDEALDKIATFEKFERHEFSFKQKVAIAAHVNNPDLFEKQKGSGLSINMKRDGGVTLDRRHVVSSENMNQHYAETLVGKTLVEAAMLLEQRASISDARVKVKRPLTLMTVRAAAHKRYKAFFGYAVNIFIGESTRNSSLGEKIDPDHPDMKDDPRKLDNHVARIRRAWAFDPGFKAINHSPPDHTDI